MEKSVLMISISISRSRRYASLFVVLFGQLVVSLDMTVLNIALPDLTAAIRPTSDQQLWIVDAYSLVLAGLLVSASSLSDRFGRKRMLLSGFIVFGVASALVMIASDPLAVIAVRALLGVGGAMIMPTTISMIRSIFTDGKERAFALAAWSIMSGLGTAIGPLIGGVLLQTFDWHAAFLFNVPLMAIGFIMGIFILPEIKLRNPGRWDFLAALMSLLGMVALMWGIKHLAAEMTFFDPQGMVAIALGIMLLAGFVVRCLRSKEPLLDMSLFRERPFTGGIVVTLGSMLSMAALLFLLAQWLQLVNGCDPFESGVKLVPMAVVGMISGAIAPALALRVGARPVMVGGLGIAALGMILLLPFINDLTYAAVAISSCLVGVGTGSLAVASTVIMGVTPIDKASSAAAFEEVSFDLGNVLGVAILGSLASVIYRTELDSGLLSALDLDESIIDSAMQSFSAAVEISKETGIEALLVEGSKAFSDSIVYASGIGGIMMIMVAMVVWRLIPKDLSITDMKH